MRSDCPLNYGIEIFGDKWTLLIIRDLMFFGKRYYNEFLSSAEGIATNLLADRLAMLEKEKIIRKGKDSQHKQKIVYSLTEKGIDLLPVILCIGLWSDKYASIKLNPNRDLIIGDAKKNLPRGIDKMKKNLLKEHVKLKMKNEE
ncbi:helix-turn-helix transcriptional regulator [Niastella caeni]|uniref:Helix-turn-helix transcriptional regulator n=1 Tax=Niastella caeni TaxID=2569763 RepID=A0A4S8HC95_9BACT|nr:helix-turn-helix domain-containing protein [Niastella caeni]THU32447.1 helix-turn-helix transcriptional regulator [Niastella caeni]